ncbi:MAG: hypothetical protein P1V97_08265 [Planctomycetota bacterium]|nr:hypothetical protein [Planctomycetota bacterium]
MKNRALRYLSRLVAVTGALSFPRALTDNTIKVVTSAADDPFVKRFESAARRDSQIKEEAESLAEENKWSLITQGDGHSRWPALDTAKLEECLPRIYRILRREAWEARDMARDCDDEEVASLLLDFATKRTALVGELEAHAFPPVLKDE